MDKRLYTPGPLTTSPAVKADMNRDLGSRDHEFIGVVAEIRNELLAVGKVSKEAGYEAVIMQGAGTFGVEAVLSSIVGRENKILNVINGAYGRRISKICDIQGIAHTDVVFEENEYPDIEKIEAALDADSEVDFISIVHCETTTGIINPLEEITRISKERNLTFFLDSMSIFGAVDLDIAAAGVHFLVSSSNKCIQGVPGFSFVICDREKLIESKGKARTLSLDLYEQWAGLEANGQFRFTPPIQPLLAYRQALRELAEEGGSAARATRYQNNAKIILEGMQEMGFELYLGDKAGYIINTFRYPESPNFDFTEFYNRLNDRGFVIYPGKLTQEDCFRIGNIGDLHEQDMLDLLVAIREVSKEMKFFD
jgi:2-aminoethylphosphonate-pyruvate transaminase